MENFYFPMLKRLSDGEWFTSRTSACGLYAVAYKRISVALREELRKMFTKLAKDDTPMVRRAAATNLGVTSPTTHSA